MRPVPQKIARLVSQPGRTPIHLRTGAWRLDGWMLPEDASRGGDFVLTHASADSLRIWVCDVTGHGSSAAAVSAGVQRILRPFAQAPLTLRNLCRANEWVFRALRGERFVCVTAIELSARGGRAIVANAGNPMLLLHRRETNELDRFPSTGMPLSLIDPAEWRAPAFKLTYLRPGDRLACFTDGVADELGRYGSSGLRRIVRSILRSQACPATDIATRISSAADADAAHDDMTVVTITAEAPRVASAYRTALR